MTCEKPILADTKHQLEDTVKQTCNQSLSAACQGEVEGKVTDQCAKWWRRRLAQQGQSFQLHGTSLIGRSSGASNAEQVEAIDKKA